MSDELDPYLQRMVEAGMDGADILHGHLKSLMLEAENNMLTRNKDEHKKYWAGQLDALTELYQLTYAIAFAKGEQNSNNQIFRGIVTTPKNG